MYTGKKLDISLNLYYGPGTIPVNARQHAVTTPVSFNLTTGYFQHSPSNLSLREVIFFYA